MKVFATLATILGVAYTTPNTHIQHLSQMGSRSGIQQHNSVMHTSANTGMPNMKKSAPYHTQTDPNQYHLQDKFGNFEYAWKNQDSEKMEKGNDMSVRGRYAYIMSDGKQRRVEYIADNNGFHILQDNADNSRAQDRNKRSVEPDLLQTRMTSFMDSSSLRDDSMVINPKMHNMMSQDMSNNMRQRNRMNEMSSQGNMYGMIDKSSNMRDNNIMSRNMMGPNRIDENIMGRNRMDENIMGRNIMGQNMYSTMMGHDMSSNVMNRNMIGQDNMRSMMGQEMIEENIMGRNIMGQNAYSNMMGRDMSSNEMNRNMMGQDMLNRNMMGRDMSSNEMNRNMM